MTQFSQMFGDLQLDHISEEEDSDAELRQEEIKKMLAEQLSDETFDDYESDTSYQNASKFSNHNNCSFVSNKDGSVNGDGSGRVSGNGDFILERPDEGIFQTPKVHENGNVKFKRIDFSAMPNTVMQNDSPTYSNENGRNNGVGLNGHGLLTNGNGNANFDAAGHLFQHPKPNEQNNNVTRRNQNEYETEEIVVPNPTLSILHKEHCPQSCNDGMGDGMLQFAENDVEQLKAICEFRERQVQRAEASLAASQKDKRGLNHQIGIMKSEMVQLKSQCNQAEKFAQTKEDEVAYMKVKIQEAIEEYEKARRNEAIAHDHCGRLQQEIDKLCQEVKLLSSLGASTQQAELNDVVRQLREKHAQDITSWRKVVADLESQVNAYKKPQQLLQEKSKIAITQESVETQTEYRFEEEIERRERELAAQEFQEEFGGLDEAFLNQLRDLSEREIVSRVRQEWKSARDKLVNHFQTEIRIYKRKLATLPSELYKMWQQTQDELGLNLSQSHIIKPIMRSAGTITEGKYTHSPSPSPKTTSSLSTSMTGIRQDSPVTKDAATTMPNKTSKEESAQVNFASVLANDEENEKRTEEGENLVDVQGHVKSSTFNSGIEEKETSSVVVQTDETLETYRILAGLIDNWSREVASTKQRAELAESKSASVEEELKILNTKFKQLQKAARICRTQWKKQEESLRNSNVQLKAHYLKLMRELDAKLDYSNDGMNVELELSEKLTIELLNVT